MKHIKRMGIVLGSLIILGVFVAIGGFLWFQSQMKPVSSDATVSDFVITKGKTAEQVGQELYEKGFIRSPLAFKMYVQFTNKTQKIQAGQFRLSHSASLTQIIDALSKGPVELWVTIPEGLRREEVSEKVIAALQMEGYQAQIFRDEFASQTEDLEGYLFPDTYLFAREATAVKVVAAMKGTFDKRMTPEMKKYAMDRGYTLNQIVTLASILERETKNKDPEERPTVSGIFYNRMKAGMPLQADATIQYAKASAQCLTPNTFATCTWWPTVYRDDYTFKSPYNTYANTGIPPAPIANPGLSALKAALYPKQNDYLYYIHDKTGQVYYARTLFEHNQNVQTYLGK